MKTRNTRPYAYWTAHALLAVSLALNAGCSGKTSKARYYATAPGSNCYAKALPSSAKCPPIDWP